MPDQLERILSKEEFDTIIALYKKEMIIQYVGVTYGSMIYFTMSEIPLERDDMFELTLWGWYWQMFRGNEAVCNSESITREFAETFLTQIMKEKIFESVKIEKSKCILSFSNEITIIIEQHSQKEDGKDLFFLSIPDDNNSIVILTNENPPRFKIVHDGCQPALV